MKKPLLVVLLFALAGQPAAASTPEIVAATKPAIVLITTYDANGRAKNLGTGSSAGATESTGLRRQPGRMPRRISR
jgi:hypothetical protein